VLEKERRMFRNDPLEAEILSSLEPDERNARWSQVKRFGRGMAVELEIGELLFSIVRAVKPETVIETGTHKGFSTLMIAQALEQNGAGHLYTVDRQDFNVPAELERFGLAGRVTFLKSDSVAALKDLAVTLKQVDFLWLDADHSTDAVLGEIEAALPLLVPGAYLAFHDTLSDPNEDVAVRRILEQHPKWEYVRFTSSRGFDLMRVQ
jgi:predicted O-methyltransferase YrrM